MKKWDQIGPIFFKNVKDLNNRQLTLRLQQRQTAIGLVYKQIFLLKKFRQKQLDVRVLLELTQNRQNYTSERVKNKQHTNYYNFHIHSPSEHKINGSYADAEIHFVFSYESGNKPANDQRTYTVLGFLLNYQEGS